MKKPKGQGARRARPAASKPAPRKGRWFGAVVAVTSGSSRGERWDDRAGTFPVRGYVLSTAPGLAVTPYLMPDNTTSAKTYTVTHTLTGCKVGATGDKRAMMRLLARLAEAGDWHRPFPVIRRDKGLVSRYWTLCRSAERSEAQ